MSTNTPLEVKTETQEVIDKYFPDGKTKYFQQSDAHQQIEGDTYLRYEKDGGILLWFGGNNGEVCILHTKDGNKLKSIIELLIS